MTGRTSNLSPETVLAIYASDEPGAVLAKRYGTSERVVSGIRRGALQKSITGGVPHPPRNATVKRTNILDLDKAREMRAKRAEGARVKRLARDYGVSTMTVFRVLAGRAWRESA